MKTDNAPLHREVKAAIAKVTGRWLLKWLPASVNIHLTREQIRELNAALNTIIGNYRPDVKIYSIDVEDCKTVQDCIDLVTHAISGND